MLLKDKGLFLGLLIVWVKGGTLPPKEILEMEGIVYVTEPTNTYKIQKHLHSWMVKSGQEADEASILANDQLMTEAVLLLKAVNRLQQEKVQSESQQLAPGRKTGDKGGRKTSQGRRQKRNVLGNILHFFTGVATDEELEAQVKRESELRDRITSTLTRQVAFEKEIADGYTTLAKEEEDLERKFKRLEKKQEKDILEIKRDNIYRTTIQEDVDKLEDILEAVQTGQCNTRHSVYLSSRAGLNAILSFQLHKIDSSPQGPVLTFSSKTYRKVDVLSIDVQERYTRIETTNRCYLLHPAHPLNAPITEDEVRMSRGECTDCAKFVHMGQKAYKTLQPGMITCMSSTGGENKSMNLTTGETFHIGADETCQNEIYTTGLATMGHSEYTLKTTGEDMLEALLLRKHVNNNKTLPEDPNKMKMAHDMMTLKLRQDVDQADRDITNFILETKDRDNFHNTVISPLGLWLIGVTVGLLIIVSLIARACWFRRCKEGGPSGEPTEIGTEAEPTAP